MHDDRGKKIAIGDLVQVLYIDRSRGAEQWMHRGKVTSFGRSRVYVRFPSRDAPQAVGPECLRVVLDAQDQRKALAGHITDELKVLGLKGVECQPNGFGGTIHLTQEQMLLMSQVLSDVNDAARSPRA